MFLFMNTTQAPKKHSSLAREHLLTAAAQVAVEKGLASLTLDAVAKRAGVSKGGLLHHFPNKQQLIESMFREMLDRLDSSIARYLEADPEARGRMTRAYIRAVTDQTGDCFESRLRGLTVLALYADPHLVSLWEDWIQRHLESCTAQDAGTLAKILRYAADGIWLEDISCGENPHNATRKEMISQLIELSYTL